MDYYKKVDDHTMDHDGKRYLEKGYVGKITNNLMDNIKTYQSRSHEAEVLLLQIQKHWLIKLLFGKEIKKHVEKYKKISYKL